MGFWLRKQPRGTELRGKEMKDTDGVVAIASRLEVNNQQTAGEGQALSVTATLINT